MRCQYRVQTMYKGIQLPAQPSRWRPRCSLSLFSSSRCEYPLPFLLSLCAVFKLVAVFEASVCGTNLLDGLNNRRTCQCRGADQKHIKIRRFTGESSRAAASCRGKCMLAHIRVRYLHLRADIHGPTHGVNCQDSTRDNTKNAQTAHICAA